MPNGFARTWSDGDEVYYPVREGRCESCGQLFMTGQMVQERPRTSRKLYHHNPDDCRQRIRIRVPVSVGPVPYVEGSETSAEAATLIGPKAETLRARVLQYIVHQGSRGATDDEIQQMLTMDPSTERPRRIELEEQRLIEKTSLTRLTRSGRRAAVYVASTTGIEWVTEVLD